MMEDEARNMLYVNNGVATKDVIESFLYKTYKAIYAVYSRELVTSLDLSGHGIYKLDDNVTLPFNLVKLDLSHNELIEVPRIVMQLQKLQILDMSHNRVKLFDDCPEFCHTLVRLDLSNNELEGPPKWIFTTSPKKLKYLKLSYNRSLGKLLNDDYTYLQKLLLHPTAVKELEIEYCRLSCVDLGILAAFPKVKFLTIGIEDRRQWANAVAQLPLAGLDKCRKLEKLNVAFTHVYTMHEHIIIYKNLKEINLARNKLELIPNEFCDLVHLEIITLSFNEIVALPQDIGKLQKLVRLYVDNNALARVPDMLCQLPNIKTLDIYNNDLEVVPNHFNHLEELDFAQNYFDEPQDEKYLEQKSLARLGHDYREDGRRLKPGDEFYSDEDEDKRGATAGIDKCENTVDNNQRKATVGIDNCEDTVDDNTSEDSVDDNTCDGAVEEKKREEPVHEKSLEASKRNSRRPSPEFVGSDDEWDPTKPDTRMVAPRSVLTLGLVRSLPPLPPYTGPPMPRGHFQTVQAIFPETRNERSYVVRRRRGAEEESQLHDSKET